jgi:hypothetical protein
MGGRMDGYSLFAGSSSPARVARVRLELSKLTLPQWRVASGTAAPYYGPQNERGSFAGSEGHRL